MSAAHTPGRLRAFTTYAEPEIRDENDRMLAVVAGGEHADARRLAAAWNACEGFDIIQLESLRVPLRQLMDRRADVAVQRDALLEALRETWRVIDAAGLHNLTRGVQLGPTVWFVKASDARELSMQAIAAASPEPAEQGPASSITVTAVCGTNEEKCNWVETQQSGSRCTTCGLTIPF